jgi:hypothetical protein
MEFASSVRNFRRGKLWKWCLGKLPAISSLALSTWRRWFGLKLEDGNCQSQLSLAWLLEIGGAPSLLMAVAGKAPPTKPEYIGKNHSRLGVGISSFQLPTLV